MGVANPDKIVETPDASSLRPVTRFNLGANIRDQPSEDLETGGRADPNSGNATAERNESPPTHYVTATRKSRREAKQPAKVQKPPSEVPQMERLANHAAN
jgi:hypothetical protein